MAHYILAVQTEPVAGREDEFNAWYTDTHMPDMLKVDGIVSARRFAALPTPSGAGPDRPYLALYEIETEDLAATFASLGAANKEMVMSSSMVENSIAFVYADA